LQRLPGVWCGIVNEDCVPIEKSCSVNNDA
jgi:hypothetical protein